MPRRRSPTSVPLHGGGPPALPPLPRPWRVRLRIALWRGRIPLAALLAALAAGSALQVLRPAPAGTVAITVTAREIDAGAALVAADLRTVAVPSAAAPAAARRAPAELVGSTVALALPAGTPVVPGLLAGTLHGPAGTVVAVVRLADPALVALLSPGDRLDVLGTDDLGGPGRVLARRALVLPQQTGSGTGAGGLGCADQVSATVVLAVDPDEVSALSGAVGSGSLTAVVVP
ncbi:MAG: SAF domain-containing protein [Cellulomonas sp.]|nr:SAF domain-containing protein [Cellulomonas sp.]